MLYPNPSSRLSALVRFSSKTDISTGRACGETGFCACKRKPDVGTLPKSVSCAVPLSIVPELPENMTSLVITTFAPESLEARYPNSIANIKFHGSKLNSVPRLNLSTPTVLQFEVRFGRYLTPGVVAMLFALTITTRTQQFAL
jgi:hypothetical protein